MMATLHDGYVAIKGAPEAIIAHCTAIKVKDQVLPMQAKLKNEWALRNQVLAENGLRILGVACKNESALPARAYDDLIFLGLVGLIDPARADVPDAIRRCQKAGIRIIMATGDQEGTAKKIAKDIGMDVRDDTIINGSELPVTGHWPQALLERTKKVSILCRVNPEQKLRLVEIFQSKKHVVAMTGDGINDTPALKKADIGIAMGQRGAQVAREAADMVLKDDLFSTIVTAVYQGRVIFSNIRKFVVYLLSCNFSEVLVIGIASLFSQHLPITPLQILFLNLVTDVFPALALGLGQGDQSYLEAPPRGHSQNILEARHWQFIFFYGTLLTLVALSVFYGCLLYFGFTSEKAMTFTFLTLGFSQLIHVFNMRRRQSSLFFNDISKNPFVWIAVIGCLAIFMVATHVPAISEVLQLTPLGLDEVAIILGISTLPLLGQTLVNFED